MRDYIIDGHWSNEPRARLVRDGNGAIIGRVVEEDGGKLFRGEILKRGEWMAIAFGSFDAMVREIVNLET